MGSAAFRNVRLYQGKLQIFLPSHLMISAIIDQELAKTKNVSSYLYEAPMEEIGHLFNGDLMKEYFISGQKQLYQGLKQWRNSTLWPIPSTVHMNRRSETCNNDDQYDDDSHTEYLSSVSTCRPTQMDSPHSHGLG